MPKKLSTAEVKAKFQQYGYTLPKNFRYQNNKTQIRVIDEQTGRPDRLTYMTLLNRIDRGRSEYMFPNALDTPVSNNEPNHKDSLERFVQKQNDTFKGKPTQYQQSVQSQSTNFIQQIMRQKTFTINFPKESEETLQALTIAMKQALPRLANKEIRLTITNTEGNPTYDTINPNTINLFEGSFENDFNRPLTTTEDDIIHTLATIKSIRVDFVTPTKGKRINPGYFPFINQTDLDLTKYGIFSNLNDRRRRKPCILQAFKASNILTPNQYKLLKSFVKTRTMPQSELKQIAEMFHIHIYCQIYYLENKSTSHVDFNESAPVTIKLIIIYDHYIFNEETNITEFYIKHYKDINQDIRFKNHPRKTLLQKYDDKRYSFSKQGMTISKLIISMIENKLLTPIDTYTSVPLTLPSLTNYDCPESYRLINIPDKVDKHLHKKILQTQHFFGYKPDPKTIESDLNDIQKVINKLPLRNHINVRLYYKFSDLMQKIMYEYGCYDDVYEFTGLNAQQLRDQCVFPKSSLIDQSYPYYSSKRLYYIDLNGAYMSCIKSIPSGIPSNNNTFKSSNTKIKDLIELLYKYRTEAKRANKTKLERTLKFIMTSSWGYSIRKPRLLKRKYTDDINKYLEVHSPYVFKYSYDQNSSGFVETVNPLVMHYTSPQFALSVLTEFNKKVDEIKSLVTVIYQNVDAFLISEKDFDKLNNLGYIGRDLGQFKIEHIFTEIFIRSPKSYVGKLEDNSYIYHTSENTKIKLSTFNDPIEAYRDLTN